MATLPEKKITTVMDLLVIYDMSKQVNSQRSESSQGHSLRGQMTKDLR
jgi:hypothetical protein